MKRVHYRNKELIAKINKSRLRLKIENNFYFSIKIFTIGIILIILKSILNLFFVSNIMQILSEDFELSMLLAIISLIFFILSISFPD